MLPPANIFDPARTHCPSCNATLGTLVDACPFCGFNAHICVRRYPFTPPALAQFIDPDHALQSKDRRIMTKAIRRFEKRFSQVTISVAYMALPENVDGREFGYWFLNRSEVKDEEERRERLHHILILIDRSNNNVSITVGYGLDCFLDDQFMYFSLERTAKVFQNRGFAAGVSAWLRQAGTALLEVHKEARFACDRWSRQLNRDSIPEPLPQATPTVSQGYHEVSTPTPSPTPKPAATPMPSRKL